MVDGTVVKPAPVSGISLVLPAFNEEECIAQAVREAVNALDQLAIPFEVIVVNDGSSDSTASIIRTLATQDPRVRLIDLPINQGYGNALRAGFLASQMPLVSFTDSDCQFYLEDLRILVERSKHFPVVVGWRKDRQDPWRRKFLSRGFNILANTMVGTGVRDIDCALKIFHRDALLRILPTTGGFLVNTEMVVRARSLGLAVEEFPVRHRPRAGGFSKVRLNEVPKVFLGLARLWFGQIAFANRSHQNPATSIFGAWLEGLALACLMVLAFALFLGNVRAPLLEPTEARYAEIPRQMLLSGNWLVPTLDNEPYLDKPPLFYWLVMGAYQMGGISDRVARWVPGLAGILTVLVSWAWLRLRAGPRAAWLAAFLLVTCARFIHYERMLAMDSVLCLFLVSGIATGDLACQSGQFKRGWWIACSILIGLALLTKGFVALPLVLGPLCLWWVLERSAAKPTPKDWLLGAGLAMAPLLAWMIPLSMRLDGFLEHFVWRHHVVRFLEPFDHAAPPWYYLPGLLLGMGPWLVLFPGMVHRIFGAGALKSGGGQPVLGLVLVVLVFNFGFFSLAGCKRPIYSIAFMPFAALALGLHLDLTMPNGWKKLFCFPAMTSQTAFALTAFMWIGIGVGAGWKGWVDMSTAYLCIAIGFALVIGLVILVLSGRGVPWAGTMAACALLGVMACWEVLPGYHEGFSLRGHLRQAIKYRVQPEDLAFASNGRPVELVCYPHRWDSAAFYLPKAKMVVFGPSELPAMENYLRANPESLLLMKPGAALRNLLAKFPTRSPRIENELGAVAVTRLEERGLTQTAARAK